MSGGGPEKRIRPRFAQGFYLRYAPIAKSKSVGGVGGVGASVRELTTHVRSVEAVEAVDLRGRTGRPVERLRSASRSIRSATA